jgi:hypothetical protein
MAVDLHTQLGYKVSPQEACTSKDGCDVSCNCAVSRRSIRNDGLFGRERDEVMVGPLRTRNTSDK